MASASYSAARRAGSRLLKASTQAAVAATTWSFATESVVVSAGTELGVALTTCCCGEAGGSYSSARPVGRERVRLIQVDAVRASTGWIVTQSGFAPSRKKARTLALKS